MLDRMWRDDKTGLYSDTTLRTWILFILFVIFSLALSVVLILHNLGIIIGSGDFGIGLSLQLLGIIGMVTFGQGGLYLGKRINEKSKDVLPFRDLN